MGVWEKIEDGIEVGGYIVTNVPKIVADGVVTVDEMAQFIKDVAAILDVPLEFKVPDNIKSEIIEVEEEEEPGDEDDELE